MMKKCKDYTKHGVCSGCGECCSAILPLSKTEIENMKKLAKNRTPHNVPVQNNAVSIDMTCPFLSSEKTEKRCAIYKDRPTVCRNFTCHIGYPENMQDMELIPVNLWNLFGKCGIVGETGDLLENMRKSRNVMASDPTIAEIPVNTIKGQIVMKIYIGAATECLTKEGDILGTLLEANPSRLYILNNETRQIQQIPMKNIKAIRQGVVLP